MRTLAVDLGTRRVGLAMSDEGGGFATPLDVLEISSPQQAIDHIAMLCVKEDVERLVVGLPINMDGTIRRGGAVDGCMGRSLSERTDKPIYFVDERLSSFDAEQRLADRRRRRGGTSRASRKKQRLDAHAAAGFLQAFSRRELPPIDVEK